MEQEETKTTAAAGAEMPPEAESWVQLHESELTELMQKQAKAAITELKRQEKQERKKEKYHNTFTLMKCYRDAVFHIENAISDGQQLELKGMTDEQQRTYLESIRRTRFKTLIMTAHTLYGRLCNIKPRQGTAAQLACTDRAILTGRA